MHANDDESIRTASSAGYVEVLRLLISNGANIRAKDNTALYWAMANNRLKVVQILLDHGACPRAVAHPELLVRVRGRELRAQIEGMPACAKMPAGGVLYQRAMSVIDEMNSEFEFQ